MLLCVAFASAAPASAAPRRIVVVGYDGMSVTGFQQAANPVMKRLLAEGASTMHARGVLPTVSSPNWESMITGAGPEQHGVTSNEWEPNKMLIPPTCKGASGTFPTIFSLLRQQRPDADIAIFHQWEGFARLVEPGIPSRIEHGKDAADTIARAIAYLDAHKPDLLFIHLDEVDDVGHDKGHMTPAYLQAIAHVDGLTDQLLKALDRKGLLADTDVILTADHGGIGKGHGGISLAELEIPWVISGPGVRKGVALQTPVTTFDTAATIAHLLGLTPSSCWIARPVLEAIQ